MQRSYAKKRVESVITVPNSPVVLLDMDNSAMNSPRLARNVHTSSGNAEFEPFKAQVLGNTVPLMSGPGETVAKLLDLPKGAQVFVIACRHGADDTVWHQVSYERRTGWVNSTQIEKVVDSKKVVRRKLNLTGLSDREKDKIHLFSKYDIERRTREFQEVLGSRTKFITRPIQRNTLSRY